MQEGMLQRLVRQRVCSLICVLVMSCFGFETVSFAREQQKKSDTPAKNKTAQKTKSDSSQANKVNTIKDGTVTSNDSSGTARPAQGTAPLPPWLNQLNTGTEGQTSPAAVSTTAPQLLVAVSHAINGHNKEIQAVYQKYLKVEPQLKGKLVLKIYLIVNGQVEDVQISSNSVPNQEFVTEVLSVIKKWKNLPSSPLHKGKVYRQEYIFEGTTAPRN